MPYKNRSDEAARSRRYRARATANPGSANRYNIPLGIVKPIKLATPKHGLKIAVIPDVQATKGVPLDHLTWFGQYIARKRPDAIVCIGDFGDFPSLSRFGAPMEREGQAYQDDLDAFHRAMDLFMDPISRERGYTPRLDFTLGNHEQHIPRYVLDNPLHRGRMSLADLRLDDYGWHAHPFLQPIAIGGVAFSHYLPSGVMGRPIDSARAILRKMHMSAFVGHLPGKDIAYDRRADGAHMAAIVSGSFYQHSMAFLSPYTNAHWRGAFFLHQVKDGQFDEMPISMDYLKRRFG